MKKIFIFLLLLSCKEPSSDCSCLLGEVYFPEGDACRVVRYAKPPCTMDYKPVCGCDGTTYSNLCFARQAGIKQYKTGTCK